MEWWQKFEQLEYSNELLVGIGLLLFLVGVMKIIRSGLKMAFWVVLCGFGMGSIAYGTNKGDINLPFNSSNDLNEYVGTGKEISAEALQLLCRKVDEP